MISSDASEHSAMPATEAVTTASTTDSARPVGAQVNSRFAQDQGKVAKIPPREGRPRSAHEQFTKI